MDIEKGVKVVEEGDGASVCSVWFGDEGAATLFGSFWHNASGKNDGDKALEEGVPLTGETG